MPKSILKKIAYLCQQISDVEWSGILLYSVEGSIKKPKNMVITLEDIIPMSKDSSAYTEYKFNEKKRDTGEIDDKMVDYFNTNPDALTKGWRIGLIHSHNKMDVFFSATDMSELNDNCHSHDYYLSLIVNNRLDFIAKVAMKAEVEQTYKEPYYCLDEDGQKFSIGKKEIQVKDNVLVVYDCDINSPEDEDLVTDKGFIDNVMDIIKEAEKKFSSYSGYNSNWKPNTWKKKRYNKKNSYNSYNKYREKKPEINRWYDSVDNNVYEIPTIKDEIEDYIEKFVMELLVGNVVPDGLYNTVESALDEVELSMEEDDDTLKDIVNVYVPLYENYTKVYGNLNHLRDFTYRVVEVLEEWEMFYGFLPKLIKELKSYIK